MRSPVELLEGLDPQIRYCHPNSNSWPRSALLSRTVRLAVFDRDPGPNLPGTVRGTIHSELTH